MELNVDSAIKEAIMEKINLNAFPPDLFKEAEKAVGTLLRQSVYPLWISSQSFKQAFSKTGLKSIYDLVPESP